MVGDGMKALHKDFWMEIRKSKARFISIFLIVALGVAFFSGLKITQSVMVHSADVYLKDLQFYDYRLVSTLGFTEENVEALAEKEDVRAAEGAISAEVLYKDAGENERVIKMHSITEKVNKLKLVAGEMPQSADECVVDSALFSEDAIGSKLVLSENNTTDDLDKFVKYNGSYKGGSTFPLGNFLTIYTTVLPLYPHLYKELEMDFEWEGKSFIDDGVGEVELVYATDGDTATFKDKITGESFRLRFLGIDTPETHAGEDPWGLDASEYTKKRLENATTIVLEAEGARTETYGRYLGFVWVDGELLNLEIIEQAYSNSTLSKSKYKDVFMEASIYSMKTGRRFFGETDPKYDYENRRFY